MLVVFVCTGNICRSPMAEAIARQRHPVGSVEFASAGTFGLQNRPMTPEAAAALDEAGIVESSHASRRLDAAIVDDADRIYVMEREHEDWLVTTWPAAAGKVALLDPSGAPVADPYGHPMTAYRHARDHIIEAVAARASEWA